MEEEMYKGESNYLGGYAPQIVCWKWMKQHYSQSSIWDATPKLLDSSTLKFILHYGELALPRHLLHSVPNLLVCDRIICELPDWGWLLANDDPWPSPPLAKIYCTSEISDTQTLGSGPKIHLTNSAIDQFGRLAEWNFSFFSVFWSSLALKTLPKCLIVFLKPC